MSDPYTLTTTAIATLALPYAADANRSSLGTPLPDTFIVYRRISSAPQQSADDAETERFCRMQLSVFSRSGTMPETDAAMKAQGFRYARETELAYDDQTGHYGTAREYTILLNQP
jgi:hypothetical protein